MSELPGVTVHGDHTAKLEYSHTTIDYGPLHKAGFKRVNNSPPDLTLNLHLQAFTNLKNISETVTVGSAGDD